MDRGNLIPSILDTLSSVPRGTLLAVLTYMTLENLWWNSVSRNVHHVDNKGPKHRQESGVSPVPGSKPRQSNPFFFPLPILLTLAEDIYNFDETGFAIGLISTQKVVTRAKYYSCRSILQPGNCEWVTDRGNIR